MTLSSPSGSASTRVTEGWSADASSSSAAGGSWAKRWRATAAVLMRLSSRYWLQTPPRSGRSTRARKDGMTLRSSSSMRPAYSRPRERVGPHAQEQLLVGLPGRVHADVGHRRGRQHAAGGVERLGPHGLAPHEVGVPRRLGVAHAVVIGHAAEHVAVGVEEAVEVAHVARAEVRAADVGIAVVAEAPLDPGVVGDVAGRLLEVAGDAPPLEDLGEEVRRLLAGQVDAAQLGDRVVAVLDEHLLVERLGPFEPDRGVDAASPSMSSSPTNSSRNRRRSDFAEREYLAKSAPFTTSGRLTSANTGPSRLVK